MNWLKYLTTPIDDWRDAWSFLSLHAGLLVTAWGLIPAADQAAIAAWFGLDGAQSFVPAVLGLLVVYTRLLKQSGQA